MTKFYSAAKCRPLDPLTPLWLTTILLAVLLVVVALAVGGCHSDPCHAHGGTRHVLDIDGAWYYKCYDGTLV